MIRRFAERFARGRSIRRMMSVAGQSVPIHVSPDAQLKYLKPGGKAFDRDLVMLAEHCVGPNDVVWDVGANVGTFAVAAAAVAVRGQVYAIEADIWLVGLLRRSAAESVYMGRIHVIPCAASAAPGVARFMIASRGRASNALESSGGRSQMGGVRETVLVPTLALDDLLEHIPAPQFVKIDVEGAEHLVIEGASQLIDVIRPVFYIEVDERHRPAIFARFAAAGYQAMDPSSGNLLDECVENTLFRPSASEGS